MIWKRRMSPRALLTHVAKHEDEYVREYVEAFLEERQEVQTKIAAVSRTGYTEAARALMFRAGLALAVFLMVTGAYLIGSAGH